LSASKRPISGVVPVGITVAKEGSLLFSEDGNETIWRVSYGK
jgi:glucose/arabinose dehydrogenase